MLDQCKSDQVCEIYLQRLGDCRRVLVEPVRFPVSIWDK